MRYLPRLAFAEPLEQRCLLSSAVQTVEFENPQDDGDIPVAASALPPKILAQLHAQYPTARLVEASFSDDDGPEFGVTLQLGGRQFELTFTPRGQLTGVEVVISPHELPRSVIDWLGENFPNARIDDATVAQDGGIVSYGVVIVTPGGKELDATLWLGKSRLNNEALAGEQMAEKVNPSPEEPRADRAEIQETEELESPPSEDKEPAAGGVALACAACERPHGGAVDQTELALNDAKGGTAVYALLADFSTAGAALAGALQAFTAGSVPIQWTPQTSGLLEAVLPNELLPLERGFAEILANIDALTQKIAADGAESSVNMRIAVTSLLVAGAMLLRHRRKAKGGVVLTQNAQSSWSWMLGISTKK